MTHEERVKLINAPLVGTFNIIERKTHAGTLIDREWQGAGRRRPSVYNWDEGNYDGVSLDEYVKQLERA